MINLDKIDADVMEQDRIMRKLFDQPPSVTDYICNWSIKHHFVYVETPKVACTSIKRILQQAEIGRTLMFEDPSDVHSRELSPLLAPRSDISMFEKAIEGDEYFRFCFVRNPFARALSCWLDKIVNNEWERARLAPLLGLDPESPSSFLSFLEGVDRQSEDERDIHWASQTFLVRPNRIKYSFVGRFETFKSHFMAVCDRLKLSDYVDGLPDTLHATKAHQKIAEYVGSRETELIHKIYESDFRNFGYGWDPSMV